MQTLALCCAMTRVWAGNREQVTKRLRGGKMEREEVKSCVCVCVCAQEKEIHIQRISWCTGKMQYEIQTVVSEGRFDLAQTKCYYDANKTTFKFTRGKDQWILSAVVHTSSKKKKGKPNLKCRSSLKCISANRWLVRTERSQTPITKWIRISGWISASLDSSVHKCAMELTSGLCGVMSLYHFAANFVVWSWFMFFWKTHLCPNFNFLVHI